MGNVKVKAIKKYNDVAERKIRNPGDVYEVTEERAKHLERQGMVKIYAAKKKKEKG